MDSIEDVAEVLAYSKYVVALTGAGVSTESGIPDFRGPSGIWTKDPEAERRAYEVYDKFLKNPLEYWKESIESPIRKIIESAKPNPSHYAFAELEKMGILKCIITQNIDNLHQKAGSKNVIDFHGNISKLRCLNCGRRYSRTSFDVNRLLMENRVPMCECKYPLKSDIVYFNEPIPEDVYKRSIEEIIKCDAMIVAGTSAVVYPAAQLPRIAKNKPLPALIIEINAEPTPLTAENISDYFIRGKTGEILPRIVEEIKKYK